MPFETLAVGDALDEMFLDLEDAVGVPAFG